MNILFGDNHMQNSGNCKKGGVALRTTLVLKIRLKKFVSVNFHQTMWVTSYFFISQAKKLARDGCVITFLDNFIFFWVPSMKNINLNILKI
jgi:hypothetical protein